jgi:hypothetical protein
VAFESTGLHPRTTVFGQHERMETAMARIIPRTNAKSPSNFFVHRKQLSKNKQTTLPFTSL